MSIRKDRHSRVRIETWRGPKDTTIRKVTVRNWDGTFQGPTNFRGSVVG